MVLLGSGVAAVYSHIFGYEAQNDVFFCYASFHQLVGDERVNVVLLYPDFAVYEVEMKRQTPRTQTGRCANQPIAIDNAGARGRVIIVLLRLG